ncbi:hypothetical protein QCA50_007459 [Cerrena zonata]|uniref:AMP-dependent synthetase/ligase domain-containing protein n=1 Tax=Cerrena zonata TaxID=2478898 RepID=A0AAW0GIT3_9APHY
MSSLDPDDYISLPIPPVPKTQGLTSSTFKIPPLDGSLTLPQIYDWNLKHSPTHPLFEYADEDGVITTLTWAQVVRGVHHAGAYVKLKIAKDQQRSLEDRPIVSILAYTDFVTYFTFLVGILRAGYVAAFISPRNSPEAIAHLLSNTNSHYIFVGSEAALQTSAIQSMDILTARYPTIRAPVIFPMVTFEDLYHPDSQGVLNGQSEVELPPCDVKLSDSALFTHSSGSTAYPKSIRFNHHRYLLLCLAPFYGEHDKTGLRMSSHSIPMYHGMGMVQTAWTAASGMIITTPKPHSPALPITAESTLTGAVATKSDVIFCVPTFIEEWSRDSECIKHLKNLKGVWFGGSPLSKEVGDELTDQGVNILNTYGIAECGGLMSPLFPENLGKDWIYFKFTPNIKPFFISSGDQYSAAHILPNPHHVPCVLNSTVDHNTRTAYATNDYLEPHPTRPDYWRVVDRVDNEIIHSSGLKTHPGPLETILHHDPYIESAVIFGNGREKPGVIIDPRGDHKFDPVDKDKLAEFRKMVWPSVERLNQYAPPQSRISEEMILVSSPHKPFVYTAKFSVRRQAMIELYQPEIDALYIGP